MSADSVSRFVRPLASTLAAVAAAVCGASACTVQPLQEPTAQSKEALGGGALDPADPAVGVLLRSDGWTCTGGLVAPDVVLTLGGCANPATLAGVSFSAGGMGAPVADLIAPIDGASPVNQFGADCTLSPQYEVGLVRLARAVQGVTPLPYASSDEAAPASQTCTVVGYGADSTQTPYTRRSGTELLTPSSEGDSFYGTLGSGGALAEGDQGAPVLCSGVIVGFPTCLGAIGPANEQFVTRISVVSNWITSQIGAWDCPAGDVWDPAAQSCVEPNPCPAGWYWNAHLHICERSPVHTPPCHGPTCI